MEGAFAREMSLGLAIVILAAAAATATLLLTAVRRLGRRLLLVEATRGTPAVAVAGTSFVVLLAFVTVVALQTYRGAQLGAQSEAVAVLTMFRTAGLLSAADRDELRSDFICYARAVEKQEWPAMRRGESSDIVDHWIQAYRQSLDTLRLGSSRDRTGLQELLAEARDRTGGRQARLSDATPSVPITLWLALLLAGCVAVLLQLAMADAREPLLVQGVLVAGVATVATSGLLLVYYLDHPFSGHTGTIAPKAIHRTLVTMEAQSPKLRLSCDRDGVQLDGR
jgi:hypothetical protein